jgi:hypothetical protein
MGGDIVPGGDAAAALLGDATEGVIFRIQDGDWRAALSVTGVAVVIGEAVRDQAKAQPPLAVPQAGAAALIAVVMVERAVVVVEAGIGDPVSGAARRWGEPVRRPDGGRVVLLVAQADADQRTGRQAGAPADMADDVAEQVGQRGDGVAFGVDGQAELVLLTGSG